MRERAHPAHMCDCEPLIYVSLTAVGHRLRSTYFRLLMVYLLVRGLSGALESVSDTIYDVCNASL